MVTASRYFRTDKVAKWWKPTSVTQEIRKWILSNNSWNKKTVLELGCGNCEMLDLLKCRGAEAIGLDICRAMLIGNKRGARVLSDVHFLPFQPDSFDAVVCIEAFKHFDRQRNVLKEIARLLRLNGKLFVQDDELGPGYILKMLPFYIANILRYGSKLEHNNTSDSLRRLLTESSITPLKLEYFDNHKKFCIKGEKQKLW